MKLTYENRKAGEAHSQNQAAKQCRDFYLSLAGQVVRNKIMFDSRSPRNESVSFNQGHTFVVVNAEVCDFRSVDISLLHTISGQVYRLWITPTPFAWLGRDYNDQSYYFDILPV